LTGTVKVLGLKLLKHIVKMLQVNHWPGYQAEADHIRYVAWILASHPDDRNTCATDHAAAFRRHRRKILGVF
jgi:hypothetical protein